MLCSCVNIKAKKFKFYYNFNVQQRNNNLSNNTFALFEANCSIEEDFVIIVCNIIVQRCVVVVLNELFQMLRDIHYLLIKCFAIYIVRTTHYALH